MTFSSKTAAARKIDLPPSSSSTIKHRPADQSSYMKDRPAKKDQERSLIEKKKRIHYARPHTLDQSSAGNTSADDDNIHPSSYLDIMLGKRSANSDYVFN